MKTCTCKKEIDFDVFESLGPLSLRVSVNKKLTFEMDDDGNYRMFNEYDFWVGTLTPEKFEKHFTLDNI